MTDFVWVIDGGKVMFKEKQSFTLFFRASMIIIQRRSKRADKKEKKKDTRYRYTFYLFTPFIPY